MTEKNTKVYGVVGHPISHSLSPSMHNAAFKVCKIDAVYVPFDVAPDNLPKAMDGVRALSIRGVNITIPHKEKVIDFLDYIDDDAVFLGAVNTVKNDDGKLYGYNTDVYGFIQSLKENNVHLEGKKVTVFGAGGAARAVGYGLLKEKVAFLNIVNRSFQRAKSLADKLSVIGNALAYPLRDSVVDALLEDTDIIVNTTSVGMSPNDTFLFNYDLIKPGIVVVDIIYNPCKTLLLEVASRKGCKTVNGVGMLVHQGARAFSLWLNIDAPVEIMRKSVLRELGC